MNEKNKTCKNCKQVDVEMAIHRMAMLKGILSDDLPHLSEPIMENMLTIKTSIEKFLCSNTHILQKRNNEIQKPINSTTTNERKNME